MQEILKISDVKVEKGAKKTGFLTVQDDIAGIVKLPVGVINGSEDGPILSVTGGMYGTQYAGIDACIQVHNEIDPKKLGGVLICVPVMEMTGFQKGEDQSHIDNVRINSAFPGDPNGTLTYREAYAVFNEVVKKSKYHLDLRGGDQRELLIDFMIGSETGKKEFDAENESLAKVLGVKYYTMTPDSKGSLVSEACRLGVHSIVLLSYKGLSTYEKEDVDKCKKGIYNLLKHLEMIDGKPDMPYVPKRLEFQMHRITAKQGGLLYLNVKYGDVVSKGTKLGEIRNIWGEILQDLTAPIDGIIHAVFPRHIKEPGELILTMRRILG